MQAFYLIKYMHHTALLKHNKTEPCHTMQIQSWLYLSRGRIVRHVSINFLLFIIQDVKLNAEPTHSCTATNDATPSEVIRAMFKILYSFGNTMCFIFFLRCSFRTLCGPVNIWVTHSRCAWTMWHESSCNSVPYFCNINQNWNVWTNVCKILIKICSVLLDL
jgi:hypothetical protein